jgi:hypothetical protein
MSPVERLDALIAGFRVMARIDSDQATTALAEAIGRKVADGEDPALLAAVLAVAVQRLATLREQP